jgi:hypothetical protein
VHAFLERPIEGSWPYLWIDATYVKVRAARRIVSVAVIIAVAVNTDGRREVLGMAGGPSEAEPSRHDYYEAFRPSPTHRYSQPCGWSRLRLFLGVVGEVLTFRTGT